MCVLFIQTNGLTERFNQTISRCLAKLINESQTDWDENIDSPHGVQGIPSSFHEAFALFSALSSATESTN